MRRVLFATLGHDTLSLEVALREASDFARVHVFHPRGQKPRGRAALRRLRRIGPETKLMVHAVASNKGLKMDSSRNPESFLRSMQRVYVEETKEAKVHVLAAGTREMRWAALAFAVAHALPFQIAAWRSRRGETPALHPVPAGYFRLRDCNPTKQQLLERLAQEPRVSFATLHAHVAGSQSNVSKHLMELEAWGLIAADRRGRVSVFETTDMFPRWLYG